MDTSTIALVVGETTIEVRGGRFIRSQSMSLIVHPFAFISITWHRSRILIIRILQQHADAMSSVVVPLAYIDAPIPIAENTVPMFGTLLPMTAILLIRLVVASAIHICAITMLLLSSWQLSA